MQQQAQNQQSSTGNPIPQPQTGVVGNPQTAAANDASVSALHPIVDQNTCIGCGLCTVLASNSFEMDPMSGKAHAIGANDPDEILKNAEASCPVRAIRC